MSTSERRSTIPFDRLTATAVAIDRPNVDTDQIIPARYLCAAARGAGRRTSSTTCAIDDDGTPREGFPLNEPDRRRRRRS